MPMSDQSHIPNVGTVEDLHNAQRISNLSAAAFRNGGGKRSGHLLRGSYVAGNIHHRIVGKYPPAAFTKHNFVLPPQVLKELGAQSDLAGSAASFGGIGDRSILCFFADALVFGVELRVHLAGDLLALGALFA